MVLSESVWVIESPFAEPKSDAALAQGATSGQHGTPRRKSCPQIGSQQQGYTHLLQGLLAARAPRRLSRKKTP